MLRHNNCFLLPEMVTAIRRHSLCFLGAAKLLVRVYFYLSLVRDKTVSEKTLAHIAERKD